MLVFANLFLWTKLLSVYYRSNNNSWDSVNCSNNDATRDGGNFVFGVMSNTKPQPPPEHEGEDAGSVGFWIKMALIVFLVMVGGIFAGKLSVNCGFFFVCARGVFMLSKLVRLIIFSVEGVHAACKAEAKRVKNVKIPHPG